MIIGYRIKSALLRIPLFSIVIILLIILVFVKFPEIRYIRWLDHSILKNLELSKLQNINDFNNLLSSENGMNPSNMLISLFYSQYIVQFLLNIWLAIVLFTFIESKIGRVPFIILYLLFVLIAYSLTLTGIYDGIYPFPWNQGIILMFCGYFYINYFKSRIRMLYFLAPFKYTCGTFELFSAVVILPVYYVVQLIIIMSVSIRKEILFLPTPGMLINMVVCPAIGLIIGLIFKRIIDLPFIQRYFQKPDHDYHTFNDNDKKIINQLHSDDLSESEKAARIIESKCIAVISIDMFNSLYSYYLRINASKRKIKLTSFVLKRLNVNENIEEIYDVFTTVNNSDGIDMFNQIAVPDRVKIIKVLYMKNLYEEVRELARHLVNESKFDKSTKELIDYFKKNEFLW